MEPTLESSVCLICFKLTEKQIFVPTDAAAKLFINCNKYLHSTLTKDTLEDMQLKNENNVPLCKSCFDSALELTHLSEQLTTIQKDISDLTVAFSMTVFHRRSQVYSIGQSCKTSSIVEFNEACLPPNLFSMKWGDQNIQHNHNNQESFNSLSKHANNITNVKSESIDIQFDNLPDNPHFPSITNDDADIPFNKENLNAHCITLAMEQNRNIDAGSEITNVQLTRGNDSKICADPNNGIKITMSELLKSVKMPEIMLERIQIEGHKQNAVVVNSNQAKSKPYQKVLDETLLKDDDPSAHSLAPVIPMDGKLLKCFYCEKTFAQEGHRILHHKTHTGEKLYKPLCKSKFTYPSNKKSESKSGEKHFKCSFCNMKFSKLYNLKCHERTHTGERPFKCAFCEKRFNRKPQLKTHERTHTGEKPFKCRFCEKCFSSWKGRKSHEMTHTGEKPFECTFCKQKFAHLSTLVQHKRTHTKEKPFECSFCDKKFAQSSSLKFHVRNQHSEKQSLCGQSFGEKLILKAHERQHTEAKRYKCLYCEKTFSRINVKNSHQKTHREQMPVLISQCDNKNCGSLDLVKHQNSTGPMEFKCSLCDMTFSDYEKRTSHETTHSRKDDIVNENFIVGL